MNEYIFACVEAFQTAWTVVGGTGSPKVSNDDWRRTVATLCAPPPKPPEHFWEQWPRTPTTFDLYFRAGDSALGVAVGFTESISGCIRIASVEALQRFWRNALESDEDAINRWRKACEVRIANVVIEMSQPRSFQAMDLLRRKIELEMVEHGRGPQKPSIEQEALKAVIDGNMAGVLNAAGRVPRAVQVDKIMHDMFWSDPSLYAGWVVDDWEIEIKCRRQFITNSKTWTETIPKWRAANAEMYIPKVPNGTGRKLKPIES